MVPRGQKNGTEVQLTETSSLVVAHLPLCSLENRRRRVPGTKTEDRDKGGSHENDRMLTRDIKKEKKIPGMLILPPLLLLNSCWESQGLVALMRSPQDAF
ncbi:Hypothetical predicted protein [Podarcis lilfordi]|uniref:Uncharacterized protein n=1 Tax=Podarcis lilfordi TaxID=74358 RepID=A0AA35PFK4_9SAUR|nr:Hypothetical predicted protein [Podarcis lilfordi]